MISRHEWRWVAILSTLILLLISAPYILAFASQPAGYVFNGLLLNPIDGNTYFAKMQQGLRGDWSFTLPYTARPGRGTFILTFYLFLGHLARWTALPVPLVFHGARVVSGGIMLATAYLFVAAFFETPRQRLAVWLLTALGSGFGWLAVLFGGFTTDLWVAEAFPFLSAFANPHFPLAAAAELWILMVVLELRPAGGLAANFMKEVVPQKPPCRNPVSAPRFVAILVATTALGLIMPFVLLTVGMILTGWAVLTLVVHSRLPPPASRLRPQVSRFWPILLFALAALPWLIYPYLITRSHPMLAAWSAQNQNLSPPVWDYLISYGPVTLLAIPGALGVLQARPDRSSKTCQVYCGHFLLLWVTLNALALYIPFSLQRRLTIGLFFPLAVLAGMGLARLVPPASRRYPLAAALVILMALPTNLVVLLAGLHGVNIRDPALYLTSGEAAAMRWLATETPPDAVILAAPETGLYIPARTGRRVVYGHPFETVNAGEKEAAVLRFFGPDVTQAEAETLIRTEGVSYIFVGPRELALEGLLPVSGLRAVYHGEGSVTILAAHPVEKPP